MKTSAVTKKAAVTTLQQLRGRVPKLRRLGRDSLKFVRWRRDAEVAIEVIFGNGSRHVREFAEVGFDDAPPATGVSPGINLHLKRLDRAKTLLDSMMDEVRRYWPEGSAGEADGTPQQAGASGVSAARPCVFIGHGRSPLWEPLKDFLRNDLGLKTVSYESESRAGELIGPVLEQMLSEANLAVLILTAEDETASGARRARQNVIHEVGLFQGKLGFGKAILLVQEGVENFSNVAGFQHISFRGDNIKPTFSELQRALKKQGLIQ